MRGAMCGLAVAMAGAAQHPYNTATATVAGATSALLFSSPPRQTRDLCSNSRPLRGQPLAAFFVRSPPCRRARPPAGRRGGNSPVVRAGGGVRGGDFGVFGGRRAGSRPGLTSLEGKKSGGGGGGNQEMDRDMRCLRWIFFLFCQPVPFQRDTFVDIFVIAGMA